MISAFKTSEYYQLTKKCKEKMRDKKERTLTDRKKRKQSIWKRLVINKNTTASQIL